MGTEMLPGPTDAGSRVCDVVKSKATQYTDDPLGGRTLLIHSHGTQT